MSEDRLAVKHRAGQAAPASDARHKKLQAVTEQLRAALGRAVELRKSSEAETIAARAAQASSRKFLEKMAAELYELQATEGRAAN